MQTCTGFELIAVDIEELVPGLAGLAGDIDGQQLGAVGYGCCI